MVGKGMRTYVEVLLRVAPDGTETPEVVMLPDGRLFRIERVESRRRVGDGYAFSVLIGSHVTTLWKELCGWSGPRWFVALRHERCVPRAERTRTDHAAA